MLVPFFRQQPAVSQQFARITRVTTFAASSDMNSQILSSYEYCGASNVINLFALTSNYSIYNPGDTNYAMIGCASDLVDKLRVLRELFSSQTTVQACLTACYKATTKGYPYAGMEAGRYVSLQSLPLEATDLPSENVTAATYCTAHQARSSLRTAVATSLVRKMDQNTVAERATWYCMSSSLWSQLSSILVTKIMLSPVVTRI